jgi:hypothetical protein
MRSPVTALGLVLPEKVFLSNDDVIVQTMEKKLSELSLQEILERLKELSKDIKFLTALPPNSLQQYSAEDAAITLQHFCRLDGSLRGRTLKQRGVRPIMMIHDEMYFDIEMTQDEIKRRMGRPLK